MLRAGLIVSAAAAAIAIAGAPGCGPACLDDRCSLSPTTPSTVRTDYVNRAPKDASTTVATSAGSAVGSGSAALTPPPAGSGSAAGSATPPPAGSGSGAGSAGTPPPTNGAGSGSAVPPPPPPPAPTSVAWQPLGDSFKMYVSSKTVAPAGTVIRLEFVKTPEKTPFVITLESKPPAEAKSGEAVWNDCPEGKIRCDASGTKTHTLKKAGQILLQAGVNWAVTGVTDDGKGTLVTWTNNLSRELVQLRLSK